MPGEKKLKGILKKEDETDRIVGGMSSKDSYDFNDTIKAGEESQEKRKKLEREREAREKADADRRAREKEESFWERAKEHVKKEKEHFGSASGHKK